MAQRNLRIEDELKRQIETVSRTRGYRSSSAFMIEAIQEKLGRIEAVESMSEAEQRLTTDLSRITRHVNGIHNSVQALYALTDTLTKYIATCIVEPPPDLLVSARARGKLRYRKANPHRGKDDYWREFKLDGRDAGSRQTLIAGKNPSASAEVAVVCRDGSTHARLKPDAVFSSPSKKTA